MYVSEKVLSHLEVSSM